MSDQNIEATEVSDTEAKVLISTEKSYTKDEILGEINSLETEKKSFQDLADYYQGLISEADEKLIKWTEIYELLGKK